MRTIRSFFRLFSRILLLTIIGCYVGFPQFVTASPLGTDVSGTISVDTTWTTAGSPYVINGTVTIARNITLTIEPGVVVKLSPSSSVNVQGVLRSEGVAGNPVVITSLKDDSVGGDTNNDGTATSPAKGDWSDLSVASTGSLHLTQTVVRYGGRYSTNTYRSLVEVNGNGQAHISDSTLTESYGYAIWLAPNGSNLVAKLNVTTSIIENSGLDGIYASTNNGATNLVNITNTTIRNNSQDGLDLTSVSNATLTGNTVSGNVRRGVYVASANGVTLSGNSFTNNGVGNSSAAVQLSFTQGVFNSLAANSGSGNGLNGIVMSGSLAQHTTLPLNPGFPYVVTGLTVNQGVTLTLPAGLVVKLSPSSSVNVQGVLRSEGVAGNPVVITSLKDDSVGGDTNNDGTATSPAKGDWSDLSVASTGSLHLTQTVVRYGGRYSTNTYRSLVEVNGNGQAHISDSTLTESYGYAIWLAPNGSNLVAKLNVTTSIIENSGLDGIYASTNNGATNLVNITNSTIRNNGQDGIDLTTVTNGIISNSSIYRNGAFGLRNGTATQVIDARNNWWGDPSGPNHLEQNPNGQGQRVSNGVLFNPWLVVPPSGDDSSNETMLTIGESKAFTTQPPLYAVFAVDTEPAKNLLITVDLGEGQLPVNAGIIRVLASRGRIATSYAFETVAEADASTRHVELAIPNTLGGKYYIVVGLPFTVQGNVNATILAQYVDLHITEVSPNEVGNVGDATLTLDGAGFTNNMTATLISSSGRRITNREIVVGANGQVFATFNLLGAELGTYTLELKDSTTNASIERSNAVTVKKGEEGRLKLHIEGPTNVRPGRTYIYKLVYENEGDADLPATLISVSKSDPATILSVPGYATTGTLSWIIAGQETRGDIIPPGHRGSVDFSMQTRENIVLVASVVAENDSLFDWGSVENIVKPPNVSDEAWSNVWTSIKGQIGSTNREVYKTLRAINKERSGPSDYHNLIRYAVYLAAQKVNGTNEVSASFSMSPTSCSPYLPPDDVEVLMAPGMTFDRNKSAIIVTHGWWGEAPRFIELAARLAAEYPDRNVIRVTWNEGASCLVPQIVSGRIPAVAEEAVAQFEIFYNYEKWNETIYIGESFGNGVNAEISRLTGARGKALMFNAANPLGYPWANEPNYQQDFARSISIQTYDVADDGVVGERSILYIDPHEEHCPETCNLFGESHTSGVRLLKRLLDINPNLAKLLIEADWKTLMIPDRPDGFYDASIDTSGILYMVGNTGNPIPQKVLTVNGFDITPQTEESLNAVRSRDPNDKIGPAGLGDQKVVASDNTLNYTINFENMPTATAPVQELRITDQLDPNLDWSTFQFTAISYGDRVLSINTAPGILEYADQDYPPTAVITGTTEGDMRIDIEAKLNFQTGMVEWYLKAVDDATNDFPLDALAGFLPPEDGSGRGQGYVMFSIKPKTDVPLGTMVKNKATIVFDTNEPITTNEVANVVGEAVDLVVLASGPATATVNSEIDHVFTVINDGPQNATNVTLNYTLPVGSEFVAATAGQGACSGSGPVTCNLGTINNGARTTVTIKIRSTISGTLESSAAVATGVIEINAVDNSAKVRTTSIAQTPVEPPQYTLVTNTIGSGAVTVSTPGPYLSGTQLQLTALPAEGWRFVQWESSVALGDQATQSIITITVTGNATYTARFEPNNAPPPTHSIYLPFITR